MGKKMKLLPLLFKTTTDQPKSSWLWRSCSQPRTLSFRASAYNDIFRTINSAYLVDNTVVDGEALDDGGGEYQIEEVVRGLRRPGGRLFLELEETNSIMEAAGAAKEEEEEEEVCGSGDVPFKESVVLAMDSKEPYMDFKKSMEEMVEAHELKDWKGMEELLSWYLKANGRRNHEFIIGAFVDLLVGLAFRSSVNSSSCCCSWNSPNSSMLSSSFASSSSSCSSFSNVAANPCMSSSSSVEIEEIDFNSNSTTTPPYPCLSSLFEDDEEGT